MSFSFFYNFLSYLGIYRRRPQRLLLVGLPNAGQSILFQHFAESIARREAGGSNNVVMNIISDRGGGGLSLTKGNVVISALDLDHDTLNPQQNMDDDNTSNSIRTALGVVFVVDAAVQDGDDTWAEAARQLHALEARLGEGVSVLVLGDNFDFPGAIQSPQVIWDKLQAKEIQNRRAIRVCMSSLATKVGYQDGIRWLAINLCGSDP